MKRVAAFVAVGACAAAVHQASVMALVEAGLLPALAANVPAFALAWLVSYLGHRRFSFDSDRPHREAAPRFLAVSLLGFGSNQMLYAALLRWSGLHYAVALFITLLAVAVMTYVLGRSWAFRSGR